MVFKTVMGVQYLHLTEVHANIVLKYFFWLSNLICLLKYLTRSQGVNFIYLPISRYVWDLSRYRHIIIYLPPPPAKLTRTCVGIELVICLLY